MDLFGLTRQDLNNFNGAEMTDLALKTLFPQDEMTDLDSIAFNKSGNSPDFTTQFDYWSDIIERFKVMPSKRWQNVWRHPLQEWAFDKFLDKKEYNPFVKISI